MITEMIGEVMRNNRAFYYFSELAFDGPDAIALS
jgi:hypothetical protein